MHLLEIESKVTLSPEDVILPGKYYVEDVFGGQLLVMAGGGTMEPLTEVRKPGFGNAYHDGSGFPVFDKDNIGTGKPCTSILIGRTGGLGDLTLLTPVLREIKRRWPSVRLAVASIRELQQSIQNLPFIDELLQYPVTVEKAAEYDGWLWLEGVVEKGEDAKTLHSVDLVAKAIGLELPEGTDKVQAYVVTEKERRWAQWAFPRIPGVRRICVQVGASARCRTYPQQKLGEVIGKLLEQEYEVFLMGRPGEVQSDKERPGMRIVTDGYTFRQRAAIIETADCVIAPDSSLTHIAGALSVPCIALYGPFNWQQRTAYNPLTRALGHKAGFPCAGCNHHPRLNQAFPDNCPTKDKGFCGVIEAVTPQQIFDAVEEQMKKVPQGENVVGFEARD